MTVYSYTGKRLNRKVAPKRQFRFDVLSLRKKLNNNRKFALLALLIIPVSISAIVNNNQQVAEKTRVITEPAIEQPVPPPVVETPESEVKSEPVEQPSFKYTESGALAEMCAAGRQYREDVMSYGATHRQATNEITSYASYLSGISPASYSALVKAGEKGLWMDAC